MYSTIFSVINGLSSLYSKEGIVPHSRLTKEGVEIIIEAPGANKENTKLNVTGDNVLVLKVDKEGARTKFGFTTVDCPDVHMGVLDASLYNKYVGVERRVDIRSKLKVTFTDGYISILVPFKVSEPADVSFE